MTDIPVDQIQTTFRLYKMCVIIYTWNFQYKLHVQQIWNFHFHSIHVEIRMMVHLFFFFTWVFKKKDVLNLLSAVYRWMHSWQLKYFYAFRSLASIYHPSFVQHCTLMYNITVQHCSGYLPLPSPSLLNHFPKFFLPISALTIN